MLKEPSIEDASCQSAPSCAVTLRRCTLRTGDWASAAATPANINSTTATTSFTGFMSSVDHCVRWPAAALSAGAVLGRRRRKIAGLARFFLDKAYCECKTRLPDL